MDELISPSHALNDPIVSGSQTGPELYKRRVGELTNSFPDLRFTIEDMIAEKGKVVASWTFSGTHKGEFMDIPASGRKVSVEGITIHHITNGKNYGWVSAGQVSLPSPSYLKDSTTFFMHTALGVYGGIGHEKQKEARNN